MAGSYRPRRITLRDGREVTLRPVVEADATEIVQAFDRLSASSRYSRFMMHKERLDDAALQRGVHPRPGHDFVFVATIPAADSIDIVGAAQYVQAGEPGDKVCEFAVTVAEDWRRSGLATKLLASLVRRARRDGYEMMEGWVIAENIAMLALARKLKFKTEPVPGDSTVLRVLRALHGWRKRGNEQSDAPSVAPRDRGRRFPKAPAHLTVPAKV
ncbi:GNAT family N-acetyltransferase [Ramlibacter tataouinensis]|uniref:GNAT family N-acetyltransferase n=1 Tax=Ramlibacter tataouinensis TaxID=94132 RepID=UPI0022F3D342|nr:GNAT family N-acetyltransferase [Ramlibacter tataouinensis]WBX99921.1 GNAT family N-acetyltransferase [Ramlibacter tataouinensis]